MSEASFPETDPMMTYAVRYAHELASDLQDQQTQGGLVAESNHLHEVLRTLDQEEPDPGRRLVREATITAFWPDSDSIHRYFGDRIVPRISGGFPLEGAKRTVVGDLSLALGVYADALDHPETANKEAALAVKRIEQVRSQVSQADIDEKFDSITCGLIAGISSRFPVAHQ